MPALFGGILKKVKKSLAGQKIITTFASRFAGSKFIDNIEKISTSKYREQTRALISLRKLSVKGQAKKIRIYKEEFDPGSG